MWKVRVTKKIGNVSLHVDFRTSYFVIILSGNVHFFGKVHKNVKNSSEIKINTCLMKWICTIFHFPWYTDQVQCVSYQIIFIFFLFWLFLNLITFRGPLTLTVKVINYCGPWILILVVALKSFSFLWPVNLLLLEFPIFLHNWSLHLITFSSPLFLLLSVVPKPYHKNCQEFVRSDKKMAEFCQIMTKKWQKFCQKWRFGVH